MPKACPEYRTDVLACPLNAGKLTSVIELVQAMRQCAQLEASLQWQQFYVSRWAGFENTAREGWTRPWVENKTLTTSHAQMVMSQVAGSLKGYLGNIQNTYKQLVSGSSLPGHIRHQLHFINRQHAWFWGCDVVVEQPVEKVNARTGKVKTVNAKVIVEESTRRLARTLIRRAMSMHGKPHFRQYHPQVDQRSCLVQAHHTAQHPLWLRLGLRTPGKRIDLPLQTHPGFLDRQRQVCVVEQDATSSKTSNKNPRNSHPAPYAIASTIRLVLAQDHKSLSVCVSTDMRSSFGRSREQYQVKTPVLAVDMGLCTLLATDQGDLLGRGWMEHLGRIDRLLTSIARHRQRLGLPVKSERYQKHASRLKGYLKTEVNRIFNRLVQTHAPGHLILEALDFTHPNMSRRMNRLIRNFGQGLITAKLKDLEIQYGITAEFRNPAYSSKQCHRCGYVDARNRPSQEQFNCRFCNTRCHADVNGARVVRDRRSIASSTTRARYRVNATLIEQVSLFNERYPRPRGGPADPRLTNPYFKGWSPEVRSTESQSSPSPVCELA